MDARVARVHFPVDIWDLSTDQSSILTGGRGLQIVIVILTQASFSPFCNPLALRPAWALLVVRS
jgi:hypothetical protein